jgi:hypothetical protein
LAYPQRPISSEVECLKLLFRSRVIGASLVTMAGALDYVSRPARWREFCHRRQDAKRVQVRIACHYDFAKARMSEAIGGESIQALKLYPYPAWLNVSCRRMRMPILVAITNHRFISFVYLFLSGHKGYELLFLSA